MGKWVVDVRFCCMICNFKSNKGKLFQYHECYKRSALKDKWSVDPGFRCHKCNFQTVDLDLFGGHDCIKKSLIILQGSSDQAEELDSAYESHHENGKKRKKQIQISGPKITDQQPLIIYRSAVGRSGRGSDY